MNLFKILMSLGVFASVLSCSKSNDTAESNQPSVIITPAVKPIDSSATYSITITGTWKTPEHTIPKNDHFTQFVGLVHSKESGIYNLGSLASKGVEDVAEIGNSVILKKEITEQIEMGSALTPFYINIQGITGTASANAMVNIKNSQISFMSMIAPSPDWFAGIDHYDLIQNGEWVKDITVPVWGYDAGTEEGDVFAYNSPATTPQQTIKLMTPSNASVIANGNSVIAPFATVRFVKL